MTTPELKILMRLLGDSPIEPIGFRLSDGASVKIDRVEIAQLHSNVGEEDEEWNGCPVQ